MTRDIQYVAEPKHVREVTLTGATDFEFWSDYLRAEGLAPVRYGGSGQVVAVVAEIVYFGIRFTEVSFSIRAVLTGGSSSEGMRLVHAFSSSRIFAWCERAIFKTPYTHGACDVAVEGRASLRLGAQGKAILSAEMCSAERTAVRVGEDDWEGPVFLPPGRGEDERRLFFGRFRGHTVIHPFVKGDFFAFEPLAGGGALQALADSGFHPQEWVVRADATHGKSRTYRRTHVFPPDHVA